MRGNMKYNVDEIFIFLVPTRGSSSSATCMHIDYKYIRVCGMYSFCRCIKFYLYKAYINSWYYTTKLKNITKVNTP